MNSLQARIVSTSLLFVALVAPPAGADILHVDAAATSGADDGSSWANAFQRPTGLRRALAAAGSGDEIWVADGTYVPTLTGVRSRSFDLASGVALYGGFAGGETSLSQREPALNVAVLSGDLAGDDGSGNYSENSYHVVFAEQVSGGAVLDGFTIRGGNADGPSSSGFDLGGGLCLVGYSDVPVRQCVFRENRASTWGGAVYRNNNGDLPDFDDCRFEDNVAGSAGGAVYLRVGADSNVFRRCIFSGNSAPRGSVADLAVAYDVYFIDCLFHGNVATGQGGLVNIEIESYPWFVGCTIVGNFSLIQPLAGPKACFVFNSILYFNTGPGGAQTSQNQVADGCGPMSASYSCVQGGLAGTNMISADPLFVNVAGSDFRLTPTSPCVDSGNNALAEEAALDLDRTPRFEDVPSTPDTGLGTRPIVDMGAHETPGGLFDAFCAGDGSLATSCPCGNTGPAGRGCLHSGFNSGALLAAGGAASPDTVLLTASGMSSNALCIFLQGNVPIAAGSVFGDGVRCVGGALKRIGTKSASSGGAASYPGAGDPSVSARSATLGDPIQGGTDRWYQTWYRDSSAAFCPPPQGGTSNVSSGVIVHW